MTSVEKAQSIKNAFQNITGEEPSPVQNVLAIVASSIAVPGGLEDVASFCKEKQLETSDILTIARLTYFSQDTVENVWNLCDKENQEEMRKNPEILVRNCVSYLRAANMAIDDRSMGGR